MASMRAWPLAGTGDQRGDKPLLLATVEFLAHSCVVFLWGGGEGAYLFSQLQLPFSIVLVPSGNDILSPLLP